MSGTLGSTRRRSAALLISSGGVGPMTDTCLMNNTVLAAERAVLVESSTKGYLSYWSVLWKRFLGGATSGKKSD